MIATDTPEQLKTSPPTHLAPGSTGSLTYRRIRTDYQKNHPVIQEILADHYAKLLSPIFTRLFVRAALTPNQVTVLMILAGLVGAALFALPQLACKILGIIAIHLWYVFDCSDGEVARITKTFSKFGTEIDFTAHLVNHPLFNLAFIYTLACTGRYNAQLLWVTGVISISAELVLRNLICFHYVYELKMKRSIPSGGKRSLLKGVVIHFVNFFTLYPNFALAFPLVYLADRYFGTSIALFYLFVHTGLSSLLAARGAFKWVGTVLRAG